MTAIQPAQLRPCDLARQRKTHQAGNSSDGVIARSQIAEVLIHSLTSDDALRKTFELVAIKGSAQTGLDALFAALDGDPENGLDGVSNMPNQPLGDKPQRVRDDLHALLRNRSKRFQGQAEVAIPTDFRLVNLVS